MTDATNATPPMTRVVPVIPHDALPRNSCGRNNRQGKPCELAPGFGTDHAGSGACKFHGGSSPSGKKHAAFLSARQQLERLTLEPLTPDQYIDPISGLLHAVTIAAMMETACREEVMKLTDWRGDVFALTKDGFPVPVSEEVRAMVRLHLDWHKQLVSAAKACAAAKIDERVTRLAERQGAMLDAAFRIFLARMAEQHPEAFTAALMDDARRTFAGAFRELTPALVGGS